MIASHVSHEQAHVLLLKELGLQPMPQMDMRLGEDGRGAVPSSGRGGVQDRERDGDV